LRSICDLEKDIEAVCENARRLRKEVNEAKDDQKRPYHDTIKMREAASDPYPVDEHGVRLYEGDMIVRERRERTRENGIDEMPWPRDYKGEIVTLESKIELEKRAEEVVNPFALGKREEILHIRRQYDFFESLVETLANRQPQTCPICLDDKVFQT
jgi:hypothetical protein